MRTTPRPRISSSRQACFCVSQLQLHVKPYWRAADQLPAIEAHLLLDCNSVQQRLSKQATLAQRILDALQLRGGDQLHHVRDLCDVVGCTDAQLDCRVRRGCLLRQRISYRRIDNTSHKCKHDKPQQRVMPTPLTAECSGRGCKALGTLQRHPQCMIDTAACAKTTVLRMLQKTCSGSLDSRAESDTAVRAGAAAATDGTATASGRASARKTLRPASIFCGAA